MAPRTDFQDSHFHVLAVDDSLLDRKLLEKLLTISSYQVTCVDSGNKALEFLGLLDTMDPSSEQQSEAKVHLIITDYCMPEMTGYDLLQRIKESSWKDIPVVIMSSENTPSRINRCLEGGAEEFLLKPVQLSDMKRLQPHILKSQYPNANTNCFINGKSSENNNANKLNSISSQPSDMRPRLRGLTTV